MGTANSAPVGAKEDYGGGAEKKDALTMTNPWELAIRDFLLELQEDLTRGAEHGSDDFKRGYSMALQYCYDCILLKLRSFDLESDVDESGG